MNKFPDSRTRLFNQDSFYKAFEKDLSRTTSKLIIESPFLTVNRVRQLTPILRKLTVRRVKIVVNTKPFDEHDALMRYQAIECVALLQELGVKVLFTVGHHRKLAIIDDSTLWEGSLNILSQNDSCEIMRQIQSYEEVESMLSFIGAKKW